LAKDHYVEIYDDEGDVTTGPAESYADAVKRLNAAMSARWNVRGEIKEIK